MGFVANIVNRFFKMADVAALTFTAGTPFPKFNSVTGKMEGVALPAPVAPLTLTVPSPTQTPLTLVGAAGQTGDFFSIKFSDGNTRFSIGLYQTNLASDVNLGGYTYICRNQAGITDSGLTMRAGFPFQWTTESTAFGDVRTRLAELGPGLLRVQNVLSGGDGGVIQKGVFVDTANAPAASTLGTVVKKIQVFDAAGNSLGYIPVYNSIA